MQLRSPDICECDALTALCLRSKAHWGYDAAFMKACMPVLTVTPGLLKAHTWQVATQGPDLLGVASVRPIGSTACLEKLFVEPGKMRNGTGGALMQWAISQARLSGAECITIEADPQAVAFYARFGARKIGEVPSDAIAGRVLPLLEIRL